MKMFFLRLLRIAIPTHLIRLRDGGSLMTYERRIPPLGNQARLSRDEGATWSAPIILSDDGEYVDLGYPSTVELKEANHFLTVWYEAKDREDKAQLRMLKWKL